MDKSRFDKLISLLPVAVVLGLFLFCFEAVIFQDRLFAFRDAAHFYYPLFSYIQQTWASGQVPWWNPYENGGVPIAANPAASLFYPGKVIFFLISDFDTAYRVYILGHLLLAAFWAYRLARHWHASRPAATLASVAYAFSGAVLIQYSNVIFLIGAAWLPAGVLVADRMLRYRRRRDAVWLGVICALVTLGGDPQTAYHLGLLVLLLLILRRRRQKSVTRTFQTSNFKLHPSNRTWKLLGIALITGLVLAAVQIVPTVQYLVTTDRIESDAPRSVYELPLMLGKEEAKRRIADGLLCRNLEQPGHLRSVYQFSTGPWRWAELVWPNVFGRQFPLHQRWIQALPGEGQVWTPTLYAGIIPLGFAIGAFQLRRRRWQSHGAAVHRRWMSWTLLLGLLGSLGYYGVVWAIEEFTGPRPEAGAPVGGLYWLMTIVLPGYVYFRYPAKLLVLVSLGLAILAARGWDDFFAGWQVRTRRFFGGVAALSLALLVGFVLAKPVWSAWVSTTAPCPIFGPLEVQGAFTDTFWALLQTMVVSGAACLLLRVYTVSSVAFSHAPVSGVPCHHAPVSGGACPRGFLGVTSKRAGSPPAANGRVGTNPAANRGTVFILLALAVFDIGVANRWIVATAPASLWRTEPAILAQEDQPILQVYRWPRLYDPRWKTSGSVDRLAEEVRWNCRTLRPKYNLPHGVGIVNAYGTMMPAAHRELLRGTPAEVMHATGATIAILPRDQILPGGHRLEPDADSDDSEFSIWWLP